MSLDDWYSEMACANFPVTCWTQVAAAQGHGDRASRALNELCGLYWPPVYAFLRRKGESPADAEDITQGFFAKLLARGSLMAVAAENGRLRTFLLKALTRHWINERERAGAAKRGGGMRLLSLDFGRVEGNYVAEPSHRITPELEFERRWALELLDGALAELRRDAERNGRSALFEDLKGLISLDAESGSYEGIAICHGLTEGAVKAAAHRLRQRFRTVLRRAIAETVTSEAEIDDEIRYLFTLFQTP